MYLSNSHARRDLPIPAMPDDRHEVRRCSSAAGVEEILHEAELAVAAHERRLQALDLRAPPRAGDDPQRPPQRCQARPCPSARARRRPRRRWPARSRAASPRRRTRRPARRPTGSAMRCSRGRRRPCPGPSAPRVTAASPVRTPARARRSGAPSSSPSAETAATRSSAARTARSASSSVRDRRPHTAITASPMNFSTVPP